jgi:hypothetical protein
MTSDAPDPVNSGDTKSWFEFYKTKAGIVHVPVNEELAPGDMLWFLMDGKPVGGASILKCDFNIATGKYDAYYDSDNMLEGDSMVPTAFAELEVN